MFCPECGSKIPDSSKFCFSCGYKIELDTDELKDEKQHKPENNNEMQVVKLNDKKYKLFDREITVRGDYLSYIDFSEPCLSYLDGLYGKIADELKYSPDKMLGYEGGLIQYYADVYERYRFFFMKEVFKSFARYGFYDYSYSFFEKEIGNDKDSFYYSISEYYPPKRVATPGICQKLEEIIFQKIVEALVAIIDKTAGILNHLAGKDFIFCDLQFRYGCVPGYPEYDPEIARRFEEEDRQYHELCDKILSEEMPRDDAIQSLCKAVESHPLTPYSYVAVFEYDNSEARNIKSIMKDLGIGFDSETFADAVSASNEDYVYIVSNFRQFDSFENIDSKLMREIADHYGRYKKLISNIAVITGDLPSGMARTNKKMNEYYSQLRKVQELRLNSDFSWGLEQPKKVMVFEDAVEGKVATERIFDAFQDMLKKTDSNTDWDAFGCTFARSIKELDPRGLVSKKLVDDLKTFGKNATELQSAHGVKCEETKRGEDCLNGNSITQDPIEITERIKYIMDVFYEYFSLGDSMYGEYCKVFPRGENEVYNGEYVLFKLDHPNDYDCINWFRVTTDHICFHVRNDKIVFPDGSRGFEHKQTKKLTDIIKVYGRNKSFLLGADFYFAYGDGSYDKMLVPKDGIVNCKELAERFSLFIKEVKRIRML